MIEVKGLTKKYGNTTVVDHLNFSVKKGEVLGFLGPNGAGKSTTMNMMTGYISATEGSVIINGYDVYDNPGMAKRSIGYLPEIPPVYPEMTVKEYLKFAMDLKKVARKDRNDMLNDVMYRTQIADKADKLIKNLSKGYKQRVGLAQAIVGYPEVIILDEPTVGLDPEQIIEFRTLIKKLSKNHTMLISSHILSEIKAVCDEVLIINGGELVVKDDINNLPSHLENAPSLVVEAKGETEKIENVIRGVSNVIDVRQLKSTEEGVSKFSISTLNSIDVREEVFFAFAKEGIPLLSMQPTSLEDIFIAMTKPGAMVIK
ncbi:MAG: ABC transporter ATP-binding protein [Lachnospiraceae bacterium]|nr:ABC transporter ATP-binding protein [Lachnospiraceae bacterium]